MEEEVSSAYIDVDDEPVEIEHDNDQVADLEDKIDEPTEGMEFDSLDDLMAFYAKYAKEKGFAVAKRSSKKVEGVLTHVYIECTRAGARKSTSSDLLNMRPYSKIKCPAKLTAFFSRNEKWSVKAVELAHNHEMSPGKSRYFKCNRFLEPHVKRRLMLNDKAGIRMNKNFSSLVVEAGGYGNLPFVEKDVRNYINKVRRLQLGEGDANAMYNYFSKMQSDNSNFFYLMDLDEEGRLKNVFWADARSRAAFKDFGDVVTFDTTYLVNKYDMPFAPFVGVNHHGQSMLLGCGLISSEDTATFIWLFESWLKCMSECPPNAIITDQDRAMKNAIECVFPNTRHRWCLWHIMKKLPEKLKGYNQYESIKYNMQNVVYDSLTIDEFEDGWVNFIEEYQLQNNDWLDGLYEERNRWVPAFVRDTFWAGMSTTQRSESMHAFFDGYINSKTTLKQFVEQYENALAKKVENESQEDFNSYNSCYPCATQLGMEKIFQGVYTRSKFKEFQNEMFGKLSCHLSFVSDNVGFTEYEVHERVRLGEAYKSRTFKVSFNDETMEANCNCRLFEFRGIVCRHQLMVFAERDIYDDIPAKYIIKRWSKNLKRGYTKIRISYDNWADRPESRRFDKLCNAFTELCEVVSDSESWSDEVMTQVLEMKEKYIENTECGGSKIHSNMHKDSTSHGDSIGISKDSTNILDPFVTRSKGRPPTRRKVGNVEKAVRKKSKKKNKTTTCNTIQGGEEQEYDGQGTQGSIVFNSQLVRPNLYTPFIPAHGDMGVGGYFQPNYAFPPHMGIGVNYAFQPMMGVGGNVGLQPNVGNFAFQGSQHPFWTQGNNFTTMHPPSLDRGLGNEDNHIIEYRDEKED